MKPDNKSRNESSVEAIIASDILFTLAIILAIRISTLQILDSRTANLSPFFILSRSS